MSNCYRVVGGAVHLRRDDPLHEIDRVVNDTVDLEMTQIKERSYSSDPSNYSECSLSIVLNLFNFTLGSFIKLM